MDSLKWILEIVDKLSGPAKTAGGSLKTVNATMGSTAKASEDLRKKIEKLSGQYAAFKANPAEFQRVLDLQKKLRDLRPPSAAPWNNFRHGLFEIVGVGWAAYRAVKAIGGAIFDTGKKMLDSAARAELVEYGFKTFLGSQKAAEQAMADTLKIYKTGYTTIAQTQDIQMTLMRGGFKGRNLVIAREAAMQAGAFNPLHAQETAANVAESFARIQRQGRLVTYKEFVKVFNQMGLQGENLGDIETELAQRYGVKDAKGSMRALKHLGTEGGMAATPALQYFVDILSKMGGGALGTKTMDIGKLLSSRQMRLGELPDLWYQQLIHSPGYKKLSDGIAKIFSALDPTSVSGRRIIEGSTRLLDSVGSWLEKLTDKDIDGFIVKATDMGKNLWGIAAAFATVTASIAGFDNFVGIKTGLELFAGVFVTTKIIQLVEGLGSAFKWVMLNPTTAAFVAMITALAIAYERIAAAHKELGGHTWQDLKDWWNDPRYGSAAWKAEQAVRHPTTVAANPNLGKQISGDRVVHVGGVSMNMSFNGDDAEAHAQAVSSALQSTIRGYENMATQAGAP